MKTKLHLLAMLAFFTCLQMHSNAQITISPSSYNTYVDANGYYKKSAPDTMSGDMTIQGKITVKFRGDSLVFGSSKLIIKPGSEVQFEGVNILGCNGIYVEGNNAESQVNSSNTGWETEHQGRLFMRGFFDNNMNTYRRCEIKYGDYGVVAGDLLNNTDNKNGGVIRCAETDFINCYEHAVWIREYVDPKEGGRNMCMFRDCKFLWDDFPNKSKGLKGTWAKKPLKALVLLENVHGVSFTGKNVFQNNLLFSFWDPLTTGDSDPRLTKQYRDMYRGVGIKAINSSFITMPSGPCYVPNNPQTHPYKPSDGCFQCKGIYNHIDNLTYGVYYEITDDYTKAEQDKYYSNHYLALTGTKFTNNMHGAYILNGKSIFINRDSFTLNDSAYKYRVEPFANGVWLDSCKSVDVSENQFDFKITLEYPKGGGDDIFTCGPGYSTCARYANTLGNYNRSYRNSFLNSLRQQDCSRRVACEQYSQNNKNIWIECNHYDLPTVNGAVTYADWLVDNVEIESIMEFSINSGWEKNEDKVAFYNNVVNTHNGQDYSASNFWSGGLNENIEFEFFEHKKYGPWMKMVDTFSYGEYTSQIAEYPNSIVGNLDGHGNPYIGQNITANTHYNNCKESSFCNMFGFKPTDYTITFNPPSDNDDILNPWIWIVLDPAIYNSIENVSNFKNGRLNSKIEVFPNPAQENKKITIKFDELIRDNFVYLSIYDMLGREIRLMKIRHTETKEFVISLSNKGMYNFIFLDENKILIQTDKVIVQ